MPVSSFDPPNFESLIVRIDLENKNHIFSKKYYIFLKIQRDATEGAHMMEMIMTTMAYDGDDITAVLVFDWNYDNPDDGLLSALPFPSAVVFVSLFIAIFFHALVFKN